MLGKLRRFIESKKRGHVTLKVSIFSAVVYAALRDLRIAGIAYIAEAFGSIWRYRDQSAEEHFGRLGRALLGISIFAVGASMV